MAVALIGAACEERPRRSHAGAFDESEAGTNPYGIDGGLWRIPRDPDPAVTRSAPVDVAATVCPGMRVVRVDRHRGVPGSPDGGVATDPVFYGRDELGRYVPFEAVLRCELRMMNWLGKPRDEGINLMIWRGPTIFRPGHDCTWSMPARVEQTADGGRRVTLRERCRNHPSNGSVTLELTPGYTALVER